MIQQAIIISKGALFFAFSFLYLIPAKLHAQAYVSRFACYRSFEDSANVGGLFARSGFAGEFQRALSHVTPPPDHDDEEMMRYTNRDQAWSIKYGGFLELYRFSPRTTITGFFFHELNANAMNDFGFNPRAAQWEEQLQLRDFLHFGDLSTSIGIFHRCKHDIDNSDNEMNDSVNTQLVRKRTIILTGASLTQFLFERQNIKLFGLSLDARMEARLEYYFYATDYRYPLTHFGNSWKNLKGAFQVTAQIGYTLSPKLNATLRTYESNLYFAKDEEQQRNGGFERNARFELALNIQGKNSTFSFYLVNEALFDDITRVSADATDVWSLGIRTIPSELW